MYEGVRIVLSALRSWRVGATMTRLVSCLFKNMLVDITVCKDTTFSFRTFIQGLPGSPVVKHFHCRGHGFDLVGGKDPIYLVARSNRQIKL